MASKQGKSFWEVAPNPLGGRPRKVKSPRWLWNKFLEYCKWVDDNPWQDKNASNSISETGDSKSNSMHQNVKVTQRAYTLYGFCSYSGIYKWGDFKSNYAGIEGFLEVINAIESIVVSQQLDGALLRKFDSNLVARLNGIADKTINEVTGKDGRDFALPKLSDDDLKKIMEINESL